MKHYAVGLNDAGNVGSAIGAAIIVAVWVAVDDHGHRVRDLQAGPALVMARHRPGRAAALLLATLAAVLVTACGGPPPAVPYRNDAARECRVLAQSVRTSGITGDMSWLARAEGLVTDYPREYSPGFRHDALAAFNTGLNSPSPSAVIRLQGNCASLGVTKLIWLASRALGLTRDPGSAAANAAAPFPSGTAWEGNGAGSRASDASAQVLRGLTRGREPADEYGWRTACTPGRGRWRAPPLRGGCGRGPPVAG